ncbi:MULTISPECIES: ABC transporter substrate-binding protein [Bacillaceae]|uniref:SsuA/THI5-like domain-containing protein n=1 Tax=Domibacillus aminovorans TaxID=29332 RepID=A0A177KXW7_9BACI|nr:MULTISPECIES: ABC transporter substrate-binding protein [Bacillaceae]OAH57845.1 hypothetical protein AWH48_02195 [Domibacillus aminovorans]
MIITYSVPLREEAISSQGKFIKENPNTANKFVEATAKAIEWTGTTPREEVIHRFESIMEKRNRKEDAETIQY